MEFRDYRTSSLDNLPKFDPKEHRAIDHSWAAMAKLPSVMDMELRHDQQAVESVYVPYPPLQIVS